MTATACIASTAVLAPQALAAPTKVSGGKTKLTLTAKGRKALKKQHVRVAPKGVGKRHKRTYKLPVRKGRFDFGTNRGTILQRGGVRLKHRHRSIVVRHLRVKLSRSSKVTAKIGGKKMRLAILSRRRARVRTSRVNRSVGHIRFRLTNRAIKRINRRLHMHGLRSRTPLASLSVRVHRPGAGGNTGASPSPGATTDSTTSQARIAFAPAVAGGLAEAGLDPEALPGADQLPDGTIDLPVAGVSVDQQTDTVTVDLAGGIRLGSGDNSVRIENPFIVVDASGADLYAEVNGVRVKVAELEDSGLDEAIQDGATQLSDLLFQLSPEGADALNQAGGLALFVPGTPFGDIDVTLPGGGSDDG